MPTENKPADPGFDLNTPDGGRGYIAHLFKVVLKRHDYRQYINERLAGDFACTLAQHFEDVKAREQALLLRLNAADQRIDELTVPDGYCLMPVSLTAENGAKGLLIGEFKVSQQYVCHECAATDEAPDDDCEICDGIGSYTQYTPISWDLTKEIYRKAVDGLALKPAT